LIVDCKHARITFLFFIQQSKIHNQQ